MFFEFASFPGVDCWFVVFEDCLFVGFDFFACFYLSFFE